MNSSSMMPRRPAGPVRQHSLQQPPARRQQQIRRQRSTDDDEGLKIYSTNPVVPRSRFSSSSNKCDNQTNPISILERPKVRIAWGEQPIKAKHEGVEIVARQIPTGKLSRPTTGRGNNRGLAGRYPLAEKATILYSRQELAERLRLAWRQREENKSNIDIFLAHNTVEERPESRLSTGTISTTRSSPTVQNKDDDQDEVRSEIKEDPNDDRSNNNKEEVADSKKSDKLEDYLFESWFSTVEYNDPVIDANEDRVGDDAIKDAKEDDKENKEASTDEDKEEKIVTEKKSSISINCNNWNTSITINNKTEISSSTDVRMSAPTTPVKEADYSNAKLKRAGFQSGQNKAFVGPIVEKPPTPRLNSRSSNIQESSRYRRTSSAPPQRRMQVNIVIDTPGISSSRTIESETEKKIVNSIEPTAQGVFKNRPIKSAPPVKRRTKASKRRGMSMNQSKDGDDDIEDGKGKCKGVKNGRNGIDMKCTELVTMVSLVSSADSESEMDENSPRDDKLINELRNKLPTTPIIKSSNGLSGGIRKPFKSVSFQQDSFDCDSPPSQATSSDSRLSLQARFAALSRANVATTASQENNSPLITAAITAWKNELLAQPAAVQLQLQQKFVVSTNDIAAMNLQDVPLTDREKRCLAVPIGDVHDKKRKLVRCKSAVAATRVCSDAEKQSSDGNQTCLQAEMRMSRIMSQSTSVVNLQESSTTTKVITIPCMVPTPTETSIESMDKEKNLPVEPYCQTPKEKECWHLYKKMCDKGVFVSFDTVLRGMLTPTEYRLRQKELSQNC